MSFTDSFTNSPTRRTRPTRPSRSTYLPPHLRNTNTLEVRATFPDRTPEPFGFRSDSAPGNRAPPRLRGGRGGFRGRGRGGGRGWAGRSRVSSNHMEAPYVNSEPNPFDVSEKFDDLEVTDDDETGINFDAYNDIPVETSGSDIPPPVNSFDEIGLGKCLNDNIWRWKYVKPTPVQRHAIPVVMAGRDLMACAQTGSGKTAAFCFPIISGLLRQNNLSAAPGQRMGVASPLALILSPTRELSCQIHEEVKKFSYETGLKVAVAYGGTSITHQLHNMEKGVDILIATPGRLMDMIERGKISLQRIKYLALDEADRMLDMGFERQIRKIVEQMEMPPPGIRQTMLFSATFPTEIQRLATDFLSNYIFLAVGRIGSSTDLIVQRVEFVRDMDKRDRLMNLLVEQRGNGLDGKHALTLVFVETKRGADSIERWLCRNGFPATAIHGDKVQMERERALRSFKNGARPILVATDVAARGLDVPHITHVINFDLPKDIDDYVHRIGRTGRAGKSGLATAFFCDRNMPLAKSLVELMQEAKQQVPSWLTQYAETSAPYGIGRASRHGGSKFGGHDFRNSHGDQGGSSYYPNSHGDQGGSGYYPNLHGDQGGSGYYPNSHGDQGGSSYFSQSYGNQAAFGEPYIAASGAFTSIYTADAGFSAASVDSYAVGAYGHGYDRGSIVAGAWN